MTVQELIDELMKVEDKTLPVKQWNWYQGNDELEEIESIAVRQTYVMIEE